MIRAAICVNLEEEILKYWYLVMERDGIFVSKPANATKKVDVTSDRVFFCNLL